MLFIVPTAEPRPDRLDTSKGIEYHRKWGRYCVSSANNELHNKFVANINLNKRFFKGDQWFMEEDTTLFFKDESGQSRNRIKMIKNLIRPMIIQYRGNAIRMAINAKVKNVSPMAVTRKDKMLEKMLFITKQAMENPQYAGMLQRRYPIGKNEDETRQIFQNVYVDQYVKRMNMLLTYVSENNKFQTKQEHVAEELGLSGLAVMQNFEWAGHQMFSVVPSDEFYWDRNAREKDLTDSEFMGRYNGMLPTEIFEHYQPEREDRVRIENFAKQYKEASQGVAGRLPVYRNYWKDSESYEYGYVKDKYGYPYLTRINFTYEGDESPRYTDDDLIEVNSDRARRLLNGGKKKKIFVDVLRMCDFIPAEVLGSGSESPADNQEASSDIVLEWGLVPYQETELLEFNSVEFPFKCTTWAYIDGEVSSPVDDAISPQRFVNRMLSIGENQINNSRGSGTIYDKSAVDGPDGEADMTSKMSQSKPVGVNAKGRGIQNIVGNYDATIKDGTMVLFNIVDVMKRFTEEQSGVNEAIKGEQTSPDQLVGVTQLMIQRGSLMQEPFYNGISNLFLQCFQSIATVGKRIYADNERELSMAVGDEGYEVIKITKDMKPESFRCFVKRENSNEMLVNAGNQMITMLAQLGFLDKKRFADLWGRSTPDEVGVALRESVKESEEVARMQNEADKEQAAVMEQQAQADKEEQMALMSGMMEREDRKDSEKRQHDMDKIYAKTMAKVFENKQKPPGGGNAAPSVLSQFQQAS